MRKAIATLVLLSIMLSSCANPLSNNVVVSPMPTNDTAATPPIPSQPTQPAQPVAATPTNGPVSLNSAYTRDIDMGNGERALLLSPVPLNYHGEDRQWHPIDARFVTTAKGFVSERNSLVTLAALNRTTVSLSRDTLNLSWQPIGLSYNEGISTSHAITLALPMTASKNALGQLSPDQRSIQYESSWTLPGVSDEVTSSPNETEHNIIFARNPLSTMTNAQPRAGQVTLRALLYAPGAQIFANGKLQTGAFETNNALELYDAAGHRQLRLSPAHIYERDRVEQGITAHYEVTPRDAASWVVSMHVPAAWWNHPQRRYPVIWDPKFTVVQATDLASINQFPPTNDGKWMPYASGSGLGVNGTRGEVATLVRFNNINANFFPPGYEVIRAQFIVAPDDGWPLKVSNIPIGTGVAADLYAINASWDANTVAWPGPTHDPTPLCQNMMVVWNSPATGIPGSFPSACSMDGNLVKQWLQNQRANYGFLLKMSSNFQGVDSIGNHFVHIPSQSAWKTTPTTNGSTYDLAGLGVALLIQYRGPQLHDSQVQEVQLPTNDGGLYQRTDHAWRLGDDLVNKTWQAVSVKAVRDEFQDTSRGLLRMLLKRENMALVDGCDGVDLICTSNIATRKPDTPAFWEADGASFVIGQRLYGRGNEIRVPAIPPNPQANHYLVEAVGSVDAPAFPGEDYGSGIVPGTGVITINITMSATHSLKLFNLNTTPNTRLRVSVVRNGSSTNVALARVHLFKPRNINYTKDDSVDPASSNSPKTQAVLPNDSGAWALLYEWMGSAAFCDRLSLRTESAINDPNTPSAIPCQFYDDTLNAQIVVRSCPLDAYPVADGCEFMQKPDGSTQFRDLPIPGGSDFYRVYSQNGFVGCLGNGLAECSNRPNAGKKFMPWVTWRGITDRMVGVSSAPIGLNTNLAALKLQAGGGARVLLALDPPGAVTKTLDIYDAGFTAGFSGASAGILNLGGCYYLCHNVPSNEPAPYTDLINSSVRIDVRQGGGFEQHAEYVMQVNRPTLSLNGLITTTFNVAWSINIQSSSEGALSPYNITASRLNAIGKYDVAGLTLDPSAATAAWRATFNSSSQKFTDIYVSDAVIQQPANFGGAWDRVRAVILPAGIGPTGSATLCQMYCLTVRGGNGNADWRMPDVNINQLPPGTVIYNRAGEMTVYSKDGPHTANGNAPETLADVNAGFSYKTFGAKVQITEKVCPGSSNPNIVSVIEGETQMALPGLGSDTDPSNMIASRFVLCSGALREVQLTFTAEPGIPVGSPPAAYITLVGGTITIDPAYTRVQIDIGFYFGEPASDPKLFKGTGTVVIDTRGLLDAQVNGRLLGMMDIQGHMWVALNPIDNGLEAQGWLPSKDSWVVHGFWRAHFWRGRGWQARYNWLPDNNDFHLTLAASGEFKIEEGAILDTALLSLPPDDVTIGVEVAFGQFCGNDACTTTQWGAKAVGKIGKFRIGAYINLDCVDISAIVLPWMILRCADFILGSDDHILIDQFGGAARNGLGPQRNTATIAGKPVELKHRVVQNPSAPNVDQNLPAVTAQTDSFLVAFSWARDNPQPALLDPDGVVVDANNAAGKGIDYDTGYNMAYFTVAAPKVGLWKARLNNTTANTDYHIAYFANKVAPSLNFIKPNTDETVTIADNGSNAFTYRIQWTPPSDSGHLRLSLYYSATNAGALTTTQKYGGTIIENIDPALGFFDWDLSYLSKGDYQVWATLQDRVGARVSPTDTHQYVGVVATTAAGNLHYIDNTPPPAIALASVSSSSVDHGQKLCWTPSPSHDLSGYLVRYLRIDGYGDGIAGVPLTQRVAADVPSTSGAKQCTRINGLMPGITTLSFPAGYGLAAYDASDNVGAFINPSNIAVNYGSDGPIMPTITGTVNPDKSVSLSWAGTGFWKEVYYARETLAGVGQFGTGATEGNSPIDVDDITSSGGTTVSGLPTGYWYDFAVRGRTSGPSPVFGPLSNHVRLFITNGIDGNADGCPDDWQSAHSAPPLSADPDQDGLLNGRECKIGTDITKPDTDGDGWNDGAEVAAGTDPLNANSHPVLTPDNYTTTPLGLPALALAPDTLDFYAYAQSGNPLPQIVALNNIGPASAALVAASVQANASWLKGNPASGNHVQVSVDPQGLGAGDYTGLLTISAGPNAVEGNPQLLTVRLHVLAGAAPIGFVQNYLPAMLKDFASAPTPPALSIFGDGLAAGWADWSYDAQVDVNNSSPVHSGARSIAATYVAGFGGLSLRSEGAIAPQAAGYRRITLWIYAPSNARDFSFYTQSDDDTGNSALYSISVPANTWTQVVVPLSALGNPSAIKRLTLQDESGTAQPTFYVDDIALE